jgi:hypothetical protein
MGEIMPTPITSDLTFAIEESKKPLPYNVAGTTADQVAASSPPPKSIADFRARGGITNTVNQIRNNAIAEQRKQAVQKGYEKLLQGNTRAADAVYQAYSAKIKEAGGNPEEWIPPKDLFYDQQTGYFLPHKYYESVYIGSKKFEEDKVVKDKAAREQATNQSELDANTAFGQAITENPQMTKQEAMGKALEQGTVTSAMTSAADAMTDPTKAATGAKKLDLDWAKLRRQQNQDRLREMQIILSQSQNRAEAIRKAGEHIADAQKDVREAQERKRSLNALYSKALRGESVYMKIEGVDTKVTTEELNDMIRNAEVLENDTKASIDELKAMQKTNVLSPTRTNLKDASESITDKYTSPSPMSSPEPVPSAPVLKPTLSVTPKLINSSVTPKPVNDPLGIR